ncbi:Transcription factor spt20 [Lambiella insularis]|nr:Transcription factor spt20 [Lambiella insularis]
MATAVSARPAPPPPKVKRPPPPMVQTSGNGVKSSQSSPSPSLSSKRPPVGSKHPPSVPATNGVNGTGNGAGPRISNRRKESQKPGDSTNRPPRSARLAPGDSAHNDRRSSKRMPEPYVKTTGHMLRKYRKAAPSLVLHLHPTHFRFDIQDGSFSYNSPMRMLLEHIKSQTVPHDMLDDLKHNGVKFYENCLIVQVQDHRNNSTASQTSSHLSVVDKNVPFSIHNYNEHLTPSPCVPYPHSKLSERGTTSQSKNGLSTAQADTLLADAEKENLLRKDQQNDTTTKDPKGPKIFTTVLFPTQLALQEELLTFASMLDHRANNRKQSQITARTPASATMPHPPTPSSAAPSTPFPAGPPSKKQKLMFSGKDLAVLEEKLIAATAPPLFLDSVDSPKDVRTLLQKLHDPLCCNDPPAPKTRKRTVAELAADEAIAAEEQRFMLIMDERLVPSSTAASTTNAAGADGDAGAAAFEPRFERFKAIEEIRLAHQEKAQREAEQKVQLQLQQQALKARMEQQARENQQQTHQLKMREAARRQDQMRQIQNQQLHQQQLMHQQHPGSNQHSHPPGGMMPNAHQIAATQGQHSSPIIGNTTPFNNSSPLVGNVMMSQGGHSVPMNVTSSNQGAGSPSRPGSAINHTHPSVTAAMVNRGSQQPPSRNGTPQMPNGTPRLQQSTPVISNVTPNSRMSHGSPPNSTMTATPVMGHSMMNTPQQHMLMQQRQAQLAHHQQQLQQQQQGSPQNTQNLQQVAALHAHQQAQQRMSEDAYRQRMQQIQQHQMSTAQGGPSQLAPNNMAMSSHMPIGGQQPGGQPVDWTDLYRRYGSEIYQTLLLRAQAKYGVQVPVQLLQNMQREASGQAKRMVQQKQKQSLPLTPQQQQQYALQRAQQQQMAQMQNGGMMGTGMGGMMGTGMGGMQ